jgi:hypothetical protein
VRGMGGNSPYIFHYRGGAVVRPVYKNKESSRARKGRLFRPTAAKDAGLPTHPKDGVGRARPEDQDCEQISHCVFLGVFDSSEGAKCLNVRCSMRGCPLLTR